MTQLRANLPWLLALFIFTAVGAMAEDRFVHFEARKDNHPEVRLNLPVPVATQLLELAPGWAGCLFDCGDDSIPGPEVLERILEGVDREVDGDRFQVSIRSSRYNSWREADRLFIERSRRWWWGSITRIEMPMAVARALVTSRDGELNVEAGLRRLTTVPSSEGIVIHEAGDRGSVRIWVDSQPGD